MRPRTTGTRPKSCLRWHDRDVTPRCAGPALRKSVNAVKVQGRRVGGPEQHGEDYDYCDIYIDGNSKSMKVVSPTRLASSRSDWGLGANAKKL